MGNEYQVETSRSIGALEADMRTVKHDVAQISGKIDGLGHQIAKVNSQQERGLGFIAGVVFILTISGGLLLAAARMLFGVGQ